MTERREIRIPAGEADLHGLFLSAGDHPAPCVVMAHGMAGTVDSGLEPFADALAAAGYHVLAFDYRGFGRSGGAPRQTISIARQHEDYRTALAWAAARPDVDGFVLWGVSLSGGHVLEVAADRDDVRAVLALVPLVSGLAAGAHAARQHRPSQLAGSAVRGFRSRVGEALGRAPVLMPLVGPPGSAAAFSLPGAEESYRAIAGPSWRNEVAASVTVELGGYRPERSAARIDAPVLVQIADLDRAAPPHAAARAAFKARAEVRHYPCDHFDVFTGEWHERAVAHQVGFLRRHLPVPTADGPVG